MKSPAIAQGKPRTCRIVGKQPLKPRQKPWKRQITSLKNDDNHVHNMVQMLNILPVGGLGDNRISTLTSSVSHNIQQVIFYHLWPKWEGFSRRPYNHYDQECSLSKGAHNRPNRCPRSIEYPMWASICCQNCALKLFDNG